MELVTCQEQADERKGQSFGTLRIQEIDGHERKDAFRHLRAMWGAQDVRRVTVVLKPGQPYLKCRGDADL